MKCTHKHTEVQLICFESQISFSIRTHSKDSTIQKSLHFYGKSFLFLFLFLCYPYFDTFPFHMASFTIIIFMWMCGWFNVLVFEIIYMHVAGGGNVCVQCIVISSMLNCISVLISLSCQTLLNVCLMSKYESNPTMVLKASSLKPKRWSILSVS